LSFWGCEIRGKWWKKDAGYGMQDKTGCWILDTGYWMQDTGCSIQD